MPSLEAIIEPKAPKTPPKPSTRRKPAKAPPAKTRRFGAALVGYIAANDWWFGGAAAAENIRPIYATFAAGEGAMRPFLANLRLGLRAVVQPYHDPLQWGNAPSGYLELLRSGGYQALEQRVGSGPDGPLLLSTLYLPAVCTLDPGLIDPAAVAFVALTPQWWIRTQQALFYADRAAVAAVAAHIQALGLLDAPRPAGGPRWTLDELLALVPQAVHTVTYLERRTTRPLLNTAAFALQLWLAGLERGLFTLAHPVAAGTRTPLYRPGQSDPADRWHWARHTTPRYQTFWAYGVADLGLAEPVACHTTHALVDTFLAAQVQRYFAAQATAAGDHLPGAAAALPSAA